jgi:ribosomal protein S6
MALCQTSFIEQLMKKTSLLVMSNGGVVRQIQYHGAAQLPYRMKAHQTWHYEGK